MEPADEETLRFYGANAPAYAEREITSRRIRLGRFLALLAPGATILELGCGAGADTAEMLARGFDVSPTDGSPEMAEVASRRLGRPVGTLLFHDLDAVDAYDGVWANACLLHVPRPELAQVLSLIWRALKPGGAFYASFKTGDAEGRDTLNRYYNYPSPDWLREHMRVRATGLRWRSRPATSWASTMRWPRCCSSWPGRTFDAGSDPAL